MATQSIAATSNVTTVPVLSYTIHESGYEPITEIYIESLELAFNKVDGAINRPVPLTKQERDPMDGIRIKDAKTVALPQAFVETIQELVQLRTNYEKKKNDAADEFKKFWSGK